MEQYKPPLNHEWLPQGPEQFPNKKYFEQIESERVADTVDVVRNRYEYFPSGVEGVDEASYEIIEYVPSREAYSDKPIVFMQGFMAIPKDYEATLAVIAEQTGRRVIGWNELVGLEVGEEQDFNGDEDGETIAESIRYGYEEELPDTQLQKVLGMKELLNRLNITQADLMAHSEGCIHALALEVLNTNNDKSIFAPEKEGEDFKREEGNRTLFSKMMLLNPPFVQKKSIPGLVISGLKEGALRKRFVGKYGTPTDFLPTGYQRLGSEGPSGKWEIAKHAVKSIMNISRTNSADLLMELDAKNYRDETKEPNISVAAGEEDRLFPASKVNQRRATYPPGVFYINDVITMDETDHAGVMLSPERMKQYAMPFFKEGSVEPEQIDEIDERLRA
jgi:hypothetical protein